MSEIRKVTAKASKSIQFSCNIVQNSRIDPWEKHIFIPFWLLYCSVFCSPVMIANHCMIPMWLVCKLLNMRLDRILTLFGWAIGCLCEYFGDKSSCYKEVLYFGMNLIPDLLYISIYPILWKYRGSLCVGSLHPLMPKENISLCGVPWSNKLRGLDKRYGVSLVIQWSQPRWHVILPHYDNMYCLLGTIFLHRETSSNKSRADVAQLISCLSTANAQ